MNAMRCFFRMILLTTVVSVGNKLAPAQQQSGVTDVDTLLSRLKSKNVKIVVERYQDEKAKLEKAYQEGNSKLLKRLGSELKEAGNSVADDLDELQRLLEARRALRDAISELSDPQLKKMAKRIAQLERQLEQAERQAKVVRQQIANNQFLGTWSTRANGDWTLTADGEVVGKGPNANGNTGTWKIDRNHNRVLIQWRSSPRHWDSIHLPLNGNKATGDSWFAPNVATYVKIR